MTRLTLYVSALWLLLFGSALAGPIEFLGAEPDNASALRRYAVSDGATADSLGILLQTGGYLDGTARAEGGRFVVDAGSLVLIDSVYVHADTVRSMAVGLPLTPANVQALVDRQLAQEYGRGNFYASVIIDKIVRSGDNLKLHLKVRLGPTVTIGRVDLTGLTRSRPDAIDRHLPVREGDTLTDDMVARVERAASRIDYVRFTPPSLVHPRAGYTVADLELRFEERRPVTLELGGGYVPDAVDASFVWHGDIRFNNLLGGGRQARIFSERREEGRQLLQIGYAQPLFVFGSGRLEAEVSTRDYRDSFYEFGLRGRFTTHLREDFSTGVELRARRVEPDGDAASYSAWSASFLADWERVDDRFNPRTGLRLQSDIDFRFRRYADDSLTVRPEQASLNETRTSFEAAFHRSVVGPIIGHIGVRYDGLETGEQLPPPAELIFVGGPGSLRGYRNEQFAVLRSAQVTVEPRWRFSSGYLFGFYDGAYLNNRVGTLPDGVLTDEDYRYGYGVGLALTDRRRFVKLALGWNPDLPFDEPRLSIELVSDI